MNETTFQDHPIQLVGDLTERWPNLTFSFSRYFYRPQSPFDERAVFEQSGAGVTEDWLSRQLVELPDGWDMALNSVVKDGRGRTHHFPMIDFAARQVTPDDLILMRSILGAGLCRGLVFYDSGRSLHAYGLQLLEPGEWREFMGRLLLLNLPHEDPLVDTRWVGHRLVAGYCALRWSANSSHYLRMPARSRIDFSGIESASIGSSELPRLPQLPA